MLLVLIAIGMLVFSLFYLNDSGLFRGKRMVKHTAEIIDEVEDEIYDNTGGAKTRFFKAYEYEENGEKCVVRSERPMRKITNTVGKSCTIYVDSKNRKAMEKGDVLRYRAIAIALIIGAFALIGLYIYLCLFVDGVAV